MVFDGAGPAEAAGWEERLPDGSAARGPDWRDGLWAAAMRHADLLLRRWYGVYEFTADPLCLLRVAHARASRAIALPGLPPIRPGDPIGVLHLWNERIPHYTTEGPDLAWAKTVQMRMEHSLRALVAHVRAEPDWVEVRALRADTTLASHLGARRLRHVASRYGFELAPPDDSLPGRLHALGENFLLWGFTRAFNPAALVRQPFLRDRHELWISRDTLLARYG